MGNERRADVLAKLLATCDGELHQTPDGKIAIRGGLWTAPVITITDPHILSYEFDNGAGKLAAFNRLKITFTDPYNGYQQTEGDPWDDLAAQALSGEVVSQDLTVGMVTSHSQARRLAKIAMAKANPQNRLTITTDLYGLLCIDQRIITLQITELGINGTFLITAFTENGDGATCKIALSSLDASAYAWDPASEEGVAPARPSAQAQPINIPDVTGAAARVVRSTVGGAVTGLAIQVSADPPSNPAYELHGQIREQGQDDTAWQPMLLQADGSVTASDRNDGVTYEYQLAFWSAYGGTQGPWTASQFITATADTVSTGPATGFVANGGVTQSMLAWTAPNAENFGSSQVKRVAGSSGAPTPPAGAVTVATRQGSPNQSFDLTDAPGAGVFTYWIVSLNRSGYFDATSTTPPKTVTVT
nr:phage tail protein [Methylobacterium sp. WL8]